MRGAVNAKNNISEKAKKCLQYDPIQVRDRTGWAAERHGRRFITRGSVPHGIVPPAFFCLQYDPVRDRTGWAAERHGRRFSGRRAFGGECCTRRVCGSL